MNIENLFKKKYVFKKPLEESGVSAKPNWVLFVSVFLMLLIGACVFAYFVFDYITKDREGVYTVTVNSPKKIDSEKSNSVLNFFKTREENTNTLKNTPTIYIDPSR